MDAQERIGRRIMIVIAAALLAGVGFVYVSQSNAKELTDEATTEDEVSAAPVEVYEAHRGRIAAHLEATANLRAEEQVEVLAETEGRIVRVLVEEGDRVRAGRPLALLDREESEIALGKAEATAANAELAFERARSLHERELLSRDALDTAETTHRVAQQELAEARWQLERRSIRAPFDGTMTARRAIVGQHVRPGETLFSIVDLDSLVADIYLPEREVFALERGRSVSLVLKSDGEVDFSGTIARISPVVDAATGTVKVTIDIDGAPPQVRPGGFVKVRIVREERPDALLVPRAAIVRELQKTHVFVALDGKAVKRDVILGLEDGDLVEVTSGLEPGEPIVVAGQGALDDGASIDVTTTTTATG